jgi:hypothetical protein
MHVCIVVVPYSYIAFIFYCLKAYANAILFYINKIAHFLCNFTYRALLKDVVLYIFVFLSHGTATHFLR